MIDRRHFLTSSLAAPLAVGLMGAAPAGGALTGNLTPVHDPCVIKAGDMYHLFSTTQVGESPGLIAWRTSSDLVDWTLRGAVMKALPDWAMAAVPGAGGAWAPDIAYVNGRYHLYYSISTFGQNRSAIGLMTAAALDPDAGPDAWKDAGLVYASGRMDRFNAIDPNLVAGADGRYWLSFGSFWGGLKIIEIDPATGKLKAGAALKGIAARSRPGAVEAPFIIHREGYYYLFASFDLCCRGAESTYYTVVGRSKAVDGPYLDRDGKSMMNGGGLIVLHADLDPQKRFKGPGHPAILQDGSRHYIVYHAYDADHRGAATLRVARLGWSPDGWPVAL